MDRTGRKCWGESELRKCRTSFFSRGGKSLNNFGTLIRRRTPPPNPEQNECIMRWWFHSDCWKSCPQNWQEIVVPIWRLRISFFDGCQKPPTRHAFLETNSLPLKNRPVMIIQARLPIVDVLAGTQFGNDAEKHWDRCQKQIFWGSKNHLLLTIENRGLNFWEDFTKFE